MKWFFISFVMVAAAGVAWPDPPSLQDRLFSPDPAVSEPALRDVEALGPKDRKWLVVMMMARLRESPESAKTAARVLAHCGKEAEEALPDLIEAIRYDDPAVAAAVGETLVKIGPASIRPLIRVLDESNFIVRQRAAALLGAFGPAAQPAAPMLVELLHDPQADVHAAAEASLIKIGPAALPALTDALKSNSPDRRRMAAALLPRFGPLAVPPLIQALRKDENTFVRSTAAGALAEIHPVNATVLAALMDSLKDSDDNVRTAGVNALGVLGVEAKAAIGPLIVISHRDPDALIRQASLQTLASIGRGSKASLPGLSGNLKAAEPEIRRASLTALADAEIPVNEMISLLELATRDADPSVRLLGVQLAAALAKKEAAAIGLLKTAINDTDRKVQAEGIASLGEAASAPETAAQALEVALKNTDPAVRNACIQALAKLGPAAVPALLRELADSYSVLGDKAEQAIVAMGPDAIPALEKANAGADSLLQAKIAAMIKQMGKPTRKQSGKRGD